MPLAVILLLALAPASQPAGASGARVEVLDGRAILAGSGVVVRLQAGDPERWIDGPGHLELSAGSRARVTWTGEASLLLEGRNVLEWRPPTAGGPPSWDLAEVGSAHLELRRGPLDVALCGGWGARLQSGACALRGLAGDGLELDHQAGLPLDLWPPQAGEAPSVPFTVLAGARLRLLPDTGRPLVLGGPRAGLRDPHQRLGFERQRTSGEFPAWRGFAWPWNSGVPALAIEAALDGTAPTRAPLPPQLPDGPAPSAVPPRAAAPDLPVPAPTLEVAPAQPPAASAPTADAARAPHASAAAPESTAPAATSAATAPAEASPAEASPVELAATRARPMRDEGVLVMTPYGPRWIDKARPVDPELLRIQAQRRRP